MVADPRRLPVGCSKTATYSGEEPAETYFIQVQLAAPGYPLPGWKSLNDTAPFTACCFAVHGSTISLMQPGILPGIGIPTPWGWAKHRITTVTSGQVKMRGKRSPATLSITNSGWLTYKACALLDWTY